MVARKKLKHLNFIHNSIWTRPNQFKRAKWGKTNIRRLLMKLYRGKSTVGNVEELFFFFFFFWCKHSVWDLNGLENWMRVPATELLLKKCESVCGEGPHLVFIEMFADSVLFSNSLLFVCVCLSCLCVQIEDTFNLRNVTKKENKKLFSF